MGSQLRKNTSDAPGKYAPKGGTAYLMILNSIEHQDGLIHGRLDDETGAHCAIGSYFAVNPKCAIDYNIIDEVAAVNDSMPSLTRRQRKLRVVRWLKWRLKSLGMPGYERAGKP